MNHRITMPFRGDECRNCFLSFKEPDEIYTISLSESTRDCYLFSGKNYDMIKALMCKSWLNRKEYRSRQCEWVVNRGKQRKS